MPHPQILDFRGGPGFGQFGEFISGQGQLKDGSLSHQNNPIIRENKGCVADTPLLLALLCVFAPKPDWACLLERIVNQPVLKPFLRISRPAFCP